MGINTSNTIDSFYAGLDALDLVGRNGFYSHLIQQEIPMWIAQMKKNHSIDPTSEVEWLSKRRGFTVEEARKLMTAAVYLQNNRWTIWQL